MTAYWRERFDLRVFVPAATAIAFGGQLASAHASPRDMIATVALTLSLLAQFRLWDDLADRERDRREHPERTLVRASGLSAFVAACVWLGVFNLCAAAWRGGTLSASLLALLTLASAIWYGARPASRTAATDFTLLAKYPAFVFIVADADVSPLVLAASAAIVYAGACAFELWHDPTSPLRFNNS